MELGVREQAEGTMNARTLASILGRDQNNFDLLRLLAAAAVMLGHSFALHPSGGYQEPVSLLFRHTYSGDIAVDLFFFLSGVLVTSSFCQSQSPVRFVLMRAARLWPGLLVCLLVTVMVVGPMFTSKPQIVYFSAWETRWYLIKNLSLQEIAYVLPGVFERNFYGPAVNGSLWTLPIEVRCYLLVFVLGSLGLLRSTIWPVVVAASVAVLLSLGNSFTRDFFLTNVSAATRLPLLFLLGTISYLERDRVRIDWRLSALALGVSVLLQEELIGLVAFYIFVVNTTLLLSAARFALRVKLPGDYSYGVYIYGFVVQQCVAYTNPELTSYSSLLVSIPVTLGLAVLSWHAIERPSLKLAQAMARAHASRGTQSSQP